MGRHLLHPQDLNKEMEEKVQRYVASFFPYLDFAHLKQCHKVKIKNDTNCFNMLKMICDNDMMRVRGQYRAMNLF